MIVEAGKAGKARVLAIFWKKAGKAGKEYSFLMPKAEKAGKFFFLTIIISSTDILYLIKI